MSAEGKDQSGLDTIRTEIVSLIQRRVGDLNGMNQLLERNTRLAQRETERLVRSRKLPDNLPQIHLD